MLRRFYFFESGKKLLILVINVNRLFCGVVHYPNSLMLNSFYVLAFNYAVDWAPHKSNLSS